MAKSSWLTVSPTSGFGNKTIQNVGTAHTGRLQRQTVVTGRAIGIATTKTYTVTQKAKAEFIMIGAESYSVAAVGGIVTISGTSNSPKLTVSVGNGGTLGTLRVNGSTATNGSAISGDPGATAQYNWSIQIQVGENLTAAQRNISVTVTGSSSSVSDTSRIVQAASVFEYTFNIAAGTASLPASGGNSAITAQLTTKRNGKVISTRAVTPTLSGSATGFSISGTTVTAANRGTTLGEVRSIVVTGKFTTSETGEVLSDTVTVSQAANNRVIVYGKPTIISFEVADIPASGGSVSSGDVEYSQSRHYYYDSGQTETLSSLTTGGQVTFGDAVSAGSLGTTVKSRTIVGQLTCQVTMHGQTSVEGDASVYQQANSATYGAVTISGGTVSDIPASGGSVSSMSGISASQTVSFTSGSTRPGSVSITYSTKVEADSLGTTIKNRASVGTLTATATGEGSKNATKSLTVYQAGNYVAAVDLTGFAIAYSKSVSAAGGTVSPSVTQGSVKFTFTSGSTSTSTPSSTYGSLASSITYSGSAANGFSAPNSSSGAMTVPGRGTTEGGARNSGTVTATKKVTWTHASSYSGGGTKTDSMSDTDYATQKANEKTTITYGTPSVTLTVADIPASGGIVSSGTVTYSQSRTQNYTSGSTAPMSALTSGGSISYSSAVSAPSLGTTVKERTAIGTLTATVSMNGKSGSDSATVYQQANVKTAGSISYGKWQVSVSANRYTTSSSPCPASGGTCTITRSASRTRTQNYSYTSGETSTAALSNETGTPTLSISGTGASISGTTVTWASRGTTVGEVRQATVTATHSGVSATEIVYQQANVKTAGSISYGTWQVSVSANRYTTSSSPCPASGGTCTITRSATRTRTQNYSFTSGDTTQEALSNQSGTPTLSISGTGASLSGTTVTWANRGTTDGAARQATVTANMDDVTATEIVYQQANSHTDSYNEPVIDRPNASHNFPNTGGGWDSEISVSQTGTRTYTSGSTTPLTGSTSFTLSSTVRWLTFLGQRITAQKNISTSSRSATVTVSASGSGDKTSSTTIAITQDAVPYLNVSPDSLSFEAAGGTKNITIDTNEGWLIS